MLSALEVFSMGLSFTKLFCYYLLFVVFLRQYDYFFLALQFDHLSFWYIVLPSIFLLLFPSKILPFSSSCQGAQLRAFTLELLRSGYSGLESSFLFVFSLYFLFLFSSKFYHSIIQFYCAVLPYFRITDTGGSSAKAIPITADLI